MKHLARLALACILFILNQTVASAGWMDALNTAAQKISQAPPSSPGTSTSSGSGSLSSSLGATNLHGLTDYNDCMAQASGAQEKLTVQALERRLKQSPELSAQDQKKVEEDIAWLNAKVAGRNIPSPDPKNPQRYLLILTDDDQMEINGANSKFINEVHDKCEEQYGGMSQFGNGPRHAPIDTRVPFPVLGETAPVTAKAAHPTRNNCLPQMQGLRWQLMADRMENKMNGLPNLSTQERTEWEEDIALVRDMATSKTTKMPQSPDPKNPTRYLQRLNTDEQMAMNQDYTTRAQELVTSCNGGSTRSGSSMETNRLAQMHAQRAADRNRNPQAMTAESDREVEAWLAAHPKGELKSEAGLGSTQVDYAFLNSATGCFDRTKGFRAKLITDRLEKKLGNVPPEDKQDLQAWVNAWRAAEQGHSDDPKPPSPDDAQGYLRFLTNADQQAVNMASSALHNKIFAECNANDYMGVGKK